MICTNCGIKVNDKAIRCPLCKQSEYLRKEIVCQQCGAPIAVDDRFCRKCGTSTKPHLAEAPIVGSENKREKESELHFIQAKCANCGAHLVVNSDNTAHCPSCGTPYIISNYERYNQKIEKNSSLHSDFKITAGELITYTGASKDVIIPDSVSVIGDSAFRGLAITSVSIPDTVVQIKNYAFCDCINLKSIVLPSGLKTIMPNTFRGCTSLQDIFIPESVTSIEICAFSGCTNLKKINIPNSVAYINEVAFDGCKNAIVKWPDSYANRQLSKIRIVARMENKDIRFLPQRISIIPNSTLSLLYDGEHFDQFYLFCESSYMAKYNVRRNPVTNYNYCVNLDINYVYSILQSLLYRAGISRDIIQIVEVDCFGRDSGSVKNGKVKSLQFQINTN